MKHKWILVTRSDKWSDWHCTRCDQKVITGANSDPNVDDSVWVVQGVQDCDNQLIKDVMQT